MELSSVLSSDAAPGSHEWVPCVGDEFPTREAFEVAMNKLAANNFFVVRFKRGSAGVVRSFSEGGRVLQPQRPG